MRFGSRGLPVSVSAALMLISLCARPVQAQDALFEHCGQIDAPGRITALTGSSEAWQLIEPRLRSFCNQVVSTMGRLQPIVGVAFSGGNPVLGTGSALGSRFGVPRFSVTGRVNLAVAEVPDLIDSNVRQLSAESLTSQPLQSSSYPIPSIQVDVAVGLLDGFSVTPAIGGVGAIDLLGSVSFVPAVRAILLEDAVVSIGGGARIGILEGGPVTPGVSISGMYRRLTDVEVGNMQQGDAAQFRADLSTWSGRAVVSKGLLMVDVAAGAGIDHYSGDVAIAWALECRVSECLAVNGNQPIIVAGDADGDLSTTAWNVFGNIGLNVGLLKVVGEVGYQRLTDPDRLDAYRDAPNGPVLADQLGAGSLFTSFGVRFAF